MVLDDLTDDESALVAAARAGTKLVRDHRTPIRAELIRELLLGRRGELDPRGVRLHGARVVGKLDLDYLTADVGLDLVDCDIEETLKLTRAMLPDSCWQGAASSVSGLAVCGSAVTCDSITR